MGELKLRNKTNTTHLQNGVMLAWRHEGTLLKANSLIRLLHLHVMTAGAYVRLSQVLRSWSSVTFQASANVHLMFESSRLEAKDLGYIDPILINTQSEREYNAMTTWFVNAPKYQDQHWSL